MHSVPGQCVHASQELPGSDWEKYNLAKYTKHLVDHGVVDSDCSLYKAVVTRDKGEQNFIFFHPTLF